MGKNEKLILEYINKFNEVFPLYLMLDTTDEELKNILENSIKTEKRYEPDIIEGAIY